MLAATAPPSSTLPLATTAVRLSINLAQSARIRRETYIGPAPRAHRHLADPSLGAERTQAPS